MTAVATRVTDAVVPPMAEKKTPPAKVDQPIVDTNLQLKSLEARAKKELELDKQIGQLDGEILDLSLKIDDLKNRKKGLEVEREELVDKLRQVVRGDDIKGTLFETPSPADEQAEQASFGAATLAQIGIGGKLRENLEAEGIRTGKDLRTWRQGHPMKKIAGVGDDPDKGGLRKIDQAMEEWFENRRKQQAADKPPKLKPGRTSIVKAADAKKAPILSREIGCVIGEIEGKRHPDLLTQLQTGKLVKVEKVTIYRQDYVVTLSPAGYSADVYCLRPLLEKGASFDAAADDAYAGAMVECDGRQRLIGPFSQSILVRDGGAGKGAA